MKQFATLTCIPHINYEARNRRVWITKDWNPRDSQTIDCYFDPLTIRTLLQVAENIEYLLTKFYQQQSQQASLTGWFAGNYRITINSIEVCGKAYDRQSMKYCDTFSILQDKISFTIRYLCCNSVGTRCNVFKSLRQKFTKLISKSK